MLIHGQREREGSIESVHVVIGQYSELLPDIPGKLIAVNNI